MLGSCFGTALKRSGQKMTEGLSGIVGLLSEVSKACLDFWKYVYSFLVRPLRHFFLPVLLSPFICQEELFSEDLWRKEVTRYR